MAKLRLHTADISLQTSVNSRILYARYCAVYAVYKMCGNDLAGCRICLCYIYTLDVYIEYTYLLYHKYIANCYEVFAYTMPILGCLITLSNWLVYGGGACKAGANEGLVIAFVEERFFE